MNYPDWFRGISWGFFSSGFFRSTQGDPRLPLFPSTGITCLFFLCFLTVLHLLRAVQTDLFVFRMPDYPDSTKFRFVPFNECIRVCLAQDIGGSLKISVCYNPFSWSIQASRIPFPWKLEYFGFLPVYRNEIPVKEGCLWSIWFFLFHYTNSLSFRKPGNDVLQITVM